jgi:hypothetical protein
MMKSKNRKGIVREVLSYRDEKNSSVTIGGYIWAPESIRYELFKIFNSFEEHPAKPTAEKELLPQKTVLGKLSDILTRFKYSLIVISCIFGLALFLGLVILFVGAFTSTANDILGYFVEHHLVYLMILMIFPILLLIQPWIQQYCPYCNTRLEIKEDLLKYYMNTGAKVYMRKVTCNGCGYKKKEEMKKGLILEAGEKAPEMRPPDLY